MFKILSFIFLMNSSLQLFAQSEFEVSKEYPYGQVNPMVPKELSDYKAMIGTCDCSSTNRSKTGDWNKPEKMIWRFKYIMNGMAIQDETIKENGIHTGSIRQFSKDSLKWFVHYKTVKNTPHNLPTRVGNKKGDSIFSKNKTLQMAWMGFTD